MKSILPEGASPSTFVSVAARSGKMVASMTPTRVQLSRKKGWRMPPNTVKVSRPGPWGNPFVVGTNLNSAEAVAKYRKWLLFCLADGYVAQAETRAAIENLRGRNLACWCRLDAPCHADVLLELANA